jgi:pSer/pThr/pTyr-binding forkhead associated (FHA) protein
MRAFLQVIKGPGLGRKVTLREGQLLYVGRTTADANFPENPEMSSVHFSIQWLGNECQFKDLNSANGSFRNGERVSDTLVYNGDEIRAGQAIFRLVLGDETDGGPSSQTIPKPDYTATTPVTQASIPIQPPLVDTKVGKTAATPVHDHQHPAAAPPPAGMPSAEGSVGLLIAGAVQAAAAAPIEPDNAKLASPDKTTQQFVELLTAQEKFIDAVRVLAFAMGKLTAIEWSLQCVKTASADGLSKLDEKTLDTVQKWLGDRTEQLRRDAYAASLEAEHGTPASWVAMAAFWSEGSMGPPPPAPPLAPGPTQCAHAATGAILLAAVIRQPEKAPDRYRDFIRMGLQLVNS